MKLCGISVGVIIVLSCLGCADQKRTYDTEGRSRIFQKYLNGSVEEARNSLNEELEAIQSDSVLSEDGKAAQAFIACTRLYWLERRSGNTDAAVKALESARRWNVARFERAGSSKEEAVAKARSFDPETMGDQIERLDRSSNDGNLPSFYSTTPGKGAK